MEVPDTQTSVEYRTNTIAESGTPLDQLLHSKSRIMHTKLEVLAAEIQTRLFIWNQNQTRLDAAKAKVAQQFNQFSRLARYHLRDQRDLGRLRDSALQLEAQEREEDVQCWRDLFQAFRDFLANWEGHEQAKNRAIFINAGSGPQNAL